MNLNVMRFLQRSGVFTCSLLLLASCKLLHPGAKQTARATQSGVPDNHVELDRRFVDACKEKIKGNYELAVNGFNDCLRLDPNNGASHYELAGLYNAQGRNELALSNAKIAAQLEPTNEWYLVLYAQILQDAHKYAEATQVYQKLTKLAPLKVEYYYGYSDALLYEGKYKEAIKVYDEIEAKMGQMEEVTLQKAKVYERIGEFDKSVEEIKKLIQLEPDETKYYVVLGQMYMERAATFKSKGNKEKENEMTQKAHEVYLGLLKNDPHNPFALLSLADYYSSKDMPDSAFVEYKGALASPDLDMDTKLKVVGQYFFEANKGAGDKQKKQCEELLHILIDVNPGEARAHAVYAEFLVQEERFKEARSEYRKAVDLDKSKYVIWEELMKVDYQISDYNQLIADSKEAIELFPSQPQTYFFNGMGLIQAKKYNEAIEALSTGVIYVIDNKNLESEFYANLGDAYYRIKDFKKSDESYDKALSLDPDNAYVLNNYSYYLSLRNENLDKAEKMSKRSIDIDSKNANYCDTYAWILYRLGRYPEAKTWMEKALGGTDPSGVMLEHYGDILYHLGEKEKALEYWQKAKSKGGTSEFLDKKIADKKLYE